MSSKRSGGADAGTKPAETPATDAPATPRVEPIPAELASAELVPIEAQLEAFKESIFTELAGFEERIARQVDQIRELLAAQQRETRVVAEMIRSVERLIEAVDERPASVRAGAPVAHAALRVRTRDGRTHHRRARHHFSPEWTTIEPNTLSESALERVYDDPLLEVEIIG